VTRISPDSFTNQTDDRTRAGVAASSQAGAATSYYRMNVSIDDVDLHDTPKGFHITPGMPVNADVMVGKRTMLTYIMSRALPVFMDGMREP
jgi:HlyD family secretion protein